MALSVNHHYDTSRSGRIDIIRFFLPVERGADVDAKNDKQWTPLHTAASSGQFAAARLLVENGASLGAVHLVGRTPQHEASWYGNTDIIRLVLESGANVDAKRLLR